jgi:hypothetical protein
MQLPAIKEKFKEISFSHRNLLIVILGSFIFILLLIVIEVTYCFNSEACFLRVAGIFPSLNKLTGVQETDFSYRKGSYSLSKQMGVFTVSGEIIKVEKDKLTLRLEDGKEKTYLVKKDTEFIFVDSPNVTLFSDFERKYAFDGENLNEILTPGNYLTVAKFDGSQIYSESSDKRIKSSNPIVVSRKSK